MDGTDPAHVNEGQNMEPPPLMLATLVWSSTTAAHQAGIGAGLRRFGFSVPVYPRLGPVAGHQRD